ncbi:TPA: hypothetical protein P1L80_004320 [Escherichia coli]|jgi:hypothetical protein|nr:MAG: hypothetical protein [Bacteriophage sp.]HCY2339615.1 hypothetical protein [Escherichia coli]HDN3064068.1 hypothetical protein [Escherichia coli]HDV6949881.1 hypothetical protein [Escherichia coli]
MNKATASVVSAIKQVYGIDISERVIIGNKRNFFTFGTDGMDGNDFNNVQRFAIGKGLRNEPAGYKKFAIYFK